MRFRSTLFLLPLLLAACGESSTTTNTPTPTTSVTIPASVFTTTRAPAAVTLLEAKATAKAGDRVSFVARVGGRAEPFTGNMAIFVVADPSLVSCELMGQEDHCPIPYDYCCEDPAKMVLGMATIQIVAEDGIPLGATAEGAGGLEGSKFVVIDGTVLEANDEGLFTVNANSIWVGGKPNRADHNAGSTAVVAHDHDGDGKADH